MSVPPTVLSVPLPVALRAALTLHRDHVPSIVALEIYDKDLRLVVGHLERRAVGQDEVRLLFEDLLEALMDLDTSLQRAKSVNDGEEYACPGAVSHDPAGYPHALRPCGAELAA